MARRQLTEDRILEATLELIDQKGSVTAVNFREIARVLGCAHTSLYHFYETYGALLEAAAEEIVGRMRRSLSFKGGLPEFAGGVIDFAMAHKGWYRFIWMDHMPQSCYGNLLRQSRPEMLLLQSVVAAGGGTLSEETAMKLLKLGHGYVHGEICKFLSERSLYESEAQLRSEVLLHLSWLMAQGGVRIE